MQIKQDGYSQVQLKFDSLKNDITKDGKTIWLRI
jgi:hypothetical protein